MSVTYPTPGDNGRDLIVSSNLRAALTEYFGEGFTAESLPDIVDFLTATWMGWVQQTGANVIISPYGPRVGMDRIANYLAPRVPVFQYLLTFQVPCHLPSCHLPSCHSPSCHLPSCHLPSCHLPYCHFLSYHLRSCHLPSCHLPSCHLPSCHLPSCHIPSCHLPSCHLPSCHLPTCNLPFCHLPSFRLPGALSPDPPLPTISQDNTSITAVPSAKGLGLGVAHVDDLFYMWKANSAVIGQVGGDLTVWI